LTLSDLAADEKSGNNVLAKFSNTSSGTIAGPYRAFRNNMYIFPTQNVVRAVQNDASN
jgi:hypothetical protein